MMPWKPRPRIMLRHPDGTPMSLLQEHKALVQHCQQLFALKELTLPATEAEWSLQLQRTPIGKAVPADSAPATAWKACSRVLSSSLAQVSQQFRPVGAELPAAWRREKKTPPAQQRKEGEKGEEERKKEKPEPLFQPGKRPTNPHPLAPPQPPQPQEPQQPQKKGQLGRLDKKFRRRMPADRQARGGQRRRAPQPQARGCRRRAAPRATGRRSGSSSSLPSSKPPTKSSKGDLLEDHFCRLKGYLPWRSFSSLGSKAKLPGCRGPRLTGAKTARLP